MNKFKITNSKQLLTLTICVFSFLNCFAQNNEALNFKSSNANYSLILTSCTKQERNFSLSNNNSDCSKYLKNKQTGNALVIIGSGVFVLGSFTMYDAIANLSLRSGFIGTNLIIVGIGSTVSGFVIIGVAKKQLRKNGCALNLQLKGTSVGLVYNF